MTHNAQKKIFGDCRIGFVSFALLSGKILASREEIDGHKKARKFKGPDANVRGAYRRSGDLRRNFDPFLCLFVANGWVVWVWLRLRRAMPFGGHSFRRRDCP